MAVTEADWLASTDPQPMLEFLRGKVSDRKLRLFGCGCVRRAMTVNTFSWWGNAIELAERAADGRADWHAAWAALSLPSGDISAPDFAPRGTLEATLEAFSAVVREEAVEGDAFPWVNSAAVDALYATARGITIHAYARAREEKTEVVGDREVLERTHETAERKRQAAYVRDIFGNPFQSARIDPTWLTWHDGLPVSMARRMYDGRDFTDMPVLADALEEAGCQDQDILGHCRSGGKHVRGCWVIDLLLGKS
jgi:hypothetical protein